MPMQFDMGSNCQHPILAHHYKSIWSLQAYLNVCLPRDVALSVLQPQLDLVSYASLVSDSLVAWNASAGDPKPCPFDRNADVCLDDIIRLAQREILKNDHKSSNVLCFGYRMVNGLAACDNTVSAKLKIVRMRAIW